MPTERIEFEGHSGQSLAGRLERPEGAIRASAVFAHCFTCGKDLNAVRRIAAALAERGIAVLSFDFTGLGHSEGEFENTGFVSNVQDVVRAAAHLRDTVGPPGLLIGHSFGGAAVLAAAAGIPEARAVVTIGAPSEPAHLERLIGDAADEIERAGAATVSLAGRRFPVSKELLDDIRGTTLADAIVGLRRALLVMHSPVDDIVGIENASAIFTAAKHPKSFVSLDDADHLLSREDDARYAAGVIAAWAERYLDDAGEGVGTSDTPIEAPAEGAVVVQETGANPFQQTVRVGRHSLLADEPASFGGGDTGPSPYDLLTAALGACTAMTLRMYAGRKKLPLDRVTVTLGHRKVHATDCEGCEEKPQKIDEISREIALEGDLDETQRRRLMEIADRCPVHQTLERANRIVTHRKQG